MILKFTITNNSGVNYKGDDVTKRGFMASIQGPYGHNYLREIFHIDEKVDQNDQSALVRYLLSVMNYDTSEAFKEMIQNQSEHEDPERFAMVSINGKEYIVDLKDPNEVKPPNNLCHDTPIVERDGCKPSACRLESCS